MFIRRSAKELDAVWLQALNGYFRCMELLHSGRNRQHRLRIAPLNVVISSVTDPAIANLVVDANTTTLSGGMSGLGRSPCSTRCQRDHRRRRMELVRRDRRDDRRGDEFDFQTVVTHELGHGRSRSQPRLGIDDAREPGAGWRSEI